MTQRHFSYNILLSFQGRKRNHKQEAVPFLFAAFSYAKLVKIQTPYLIPRNTLNYQIADKWPHPNRHFRFFSFCFSFYFNFYSCSCLFPCCDLSADNIRFIVHGSSAYSVGDGIRVHYNGEFSFYVFLILLV